MSTKVTYHTWDDNEVKRVERELKDYFSVIKWAYQTYGEDVVYACSFGAEGVVLVDLIHRVKKDANITFLDTGLHFKETYELIEQMREKYPSLRIELKEPNLTLDEQKDKHGEELWKTNPNLCCQIRKIEPLTEALSGVTAWISGLRREQSPTRSHVNYINKDEKFKSIKICPLIHWTWEDVWNYIKLNQLPYNELHDRNYPSIGCYPCTFEVKGNENLRAGRWANSTKTECGLHQN
ncbi:phosphoadenylyl-sulfate reductase [Bacillus luteolus]|uniref:Adenosine 5'-phosphosulfate reductase n=1 Tax=Litchfieldia luteola TaxID=682179 RepID=A0ABR9QNP1_9BACI|nr:phosphoadenylyl-sulfate reductase [Cytobacillus luteolus]MBE4910129.1 phosphoadenylyl-sulfate reductase [Cytobacillus luteolus]MBP1942307.1 phosphoadenosine phosphosulfate reductase [Cytobacillus luteolus]